jgi:NDP-sugar pyrophosphorylase family protein
MHRGACGIILAGGKGTRIRHLQPDVPKPLIDIAGQPFIEWVIRYLAKERVGQFVISLGHLAEKAEAYFARRPVDGLKITTIHERSPLGTGGAVKFAAAATDGDPLLITNGDSIVLANLDEAWRRIADPQVDGVLVGVDVDDASRFGGLDVDASLRLIGFREKQPGRGLINAGIYLFKRRLLDAFPSRTPLSVETDVFPSLLGQGLRLEVVSCRAPFLDIGTPETLSEAPGFIRTYFGQKAA